MHDAAHDTLQGSLKFNPGNWHSAWQPTGLPLPEDVICLPMQDSFVLIHGKFNKPQSINGDPKSWVHQLSYSILKHFDHGQLGQMTSVDQKLLIDTIDTGAIAPSTKHANGRDWWTISFRFESNEYYSILTDPYGPKIIGVDSIGQALKYANSQCSFSPDGNWFAVNLTTIREDGKKLPSRIVIYRFDRCTGRLYDPLQFDYEGYRPWMAGLCFSPDSRYLYVSTNVEIFQFDLWAADIEESKMQIAYYFNQKCVPLNDNSSILDSHFGQSWNGPDGRIYMTTSGATVCVHAIHYPNERGAMSQFEYNSLHLESPHGRSVPHHPNYRLGPIDASPCDTLGIDNHPLAGWRWEELDGWQIRFTDNSWYEPTDWYWTFGDGQSDTTKSPYHIYADSGQYEVCLIVSNANSADTLCRWIQVGGDKSSATSWIRTYNRTGRLYPNPTSHTVWLDESWLEDLAYVRLYSMSGALMASYAHAMREIDVSRYPAGIYLVELTHTSGDRVVHKLVKM